MFLRISKSAMTRCRIVIADDHDLIRKGLSAIVSQVDGLQVVGEAGDGIELLKLLANVEADLVLLDISMPKLRGIEAIKEIKALRPDICILIVTMHKDIDFLVKSISAGANGYILKQDNYRTLLKAIETLSEQKPFITPSLSEESRDLLIRLSRGERPAVSVDNLTPREKQVLKLIAEGKTSRAIADALSISPHTIERHKAKILEKLNLKNTSEIVRFAIEKGFV